MHLSLVLVVSALLFGIGVYGVLARRNTIALLMAVELMLNAANLDLVAFDAWFRDRLHAGQSFALFVIVIAAAEVGVGFAIVLSVFRLRETISLDTLRDLADRDPAMSPLDSAKADG
jgi:NADH-quinone oxidoreductase subunit K